MRHKNRASPATPGVLTLLLARPHPYGAFDRNFGNTKTRATGKILILCARRTYHYPGRDSAPAARRTAGAPSKSAFFGPPRKSPPGMSGCGLVRLIAGEMPSKKGRQLDRPGSVSRNCMTPRRLILQRNIRFFSRMSLVDSACAVSLRYCSYAVSNGLIFFTGLQAP